MNKKIIIFSCAITLILQPVLIAANIPFHLMDKEKLILKAKELEEKAAQQERKIQFLARYATKLEQNQRSVPYEYWYRGQGFVAGVVFIALLKLYKNVTRRR